MCISIGKCGNGNENTSNQNHPMQEKYKILSPLPHTSGNTICDPRIQSYIQSHGSTQKNPWELAASLLGKGIQIGEI